MGTKLSVLTRNLLILHATVFVWGFTGLLGALISISALHLVWFRVLIAATSLFFWFKISKTPLSLPITALVKLLLTGAVVGLHWILFFYAIKVSNVSVTLVCLSSLTLFTSFLEPLFSRRRVSKLEVLTGCLIVFGIHLIFKFESKYTLGIVSGLLSALSASVFSIINSKQIKNRSASIIAFYELVGAGVWITLFLLFKNDIPSPLNLTSHDVLFLSVLGTICTALAYVAGVSVMKELSAFRVALITNMEPVYGIILAWIFLGRKEQMTPEFYVGALMILGSVFLYPFLKNKLKKRYLNENSD